MRERDEVKARLSAAGLGSVAETILGMVRPCYRIERAPTTDESLPIGTSRFGGLPDAPEGFEWPVLTGGKTPEAMEFVGQIRLQDLPNPVPERLPLQGLLSFYTRWSESRVFFYPEGTPLERVASPNPLVAPTPTGLFKSLFAELKRNPDPHHTYRPCALAFVPGLSLPDGGSALIEQLKLSPEDAESYVESVLEYPARDIRCSATPVRCKTKWNWSATSCDENRKSDGTLLPIALSLRLRIGSCSSKSIRMTPKRGPDGCGAMREGVLLDPPR